MKRGSPGSSTPGSSTRRKRIAVTGGRGFLGGAIAAYCANRGHVVVSIDLAAAGRQSPAGGRDARHAIDEIVADVRDEKQMRSAFAGAGVDTVVHAAAIAGVTQVRADLKRATDVNVGGAVAVLAAATAASVARVIDLSSEEVYGAGGTHDTLSEDIPLLPTSAYGVHKLSVELLAREFQGQLDYAAARLSWVYGTGFPRDRPPQRWLEDAAAGRASAATTGGDHAADLIHVDDAVSGISRLIEAHTLLHSAYNVGSGASVTLSAVASLIRNLQPSWTIDLGGGTLEGVSARAPLSTTRIREELDWTPELSLEEGIRRTLHDRH